VLGGATIAARPAWPACWPVRPGRPAVGLLVVAAPGRERCVLGGATTATYPIRLAACRAGRLPGPRSTMPATVSSAIPIWGSAGWHESRDAAGPPSTAPSRVGSSCPLDSRVSLKAAWAGARDVRWPARTGADERCRADHRAFD